ncbi:MAG TPA: tRNA (adenosine(37)-N6)-threonylcarbamoyltransferase complex transferase subunit TsaD [Solirubrobacteraceae bacterium]|jgi:N6-L-threonylcarbamoyladenine synthase|nr:tRNA (adenosine(37)-N6)-threonylcarbamoyltransferase complex transferase subunit TsaD [Solirubrobacteraceae bacterium]
MSILALETSCDDTCAAVIDADGSVRANVISSQTAHEDFGGVVPEIASRHHLEIVNAIVARALELAGTELGEIELIAATQGPGLIGALLVGLSTAKALASARELPFAPVDHLQGHVAANFLRGASSAVPGGGADDATPAEPFEPPFLCLIASGGHTLLTHVREHDGFEVLGRTLDDAAGEAFDKGARMLGLGYPGGAALEHLAREGDAKAFAFPGSRGERAKGGRGASRQAFAEGLDFSFAGLKTALLYRLRELSEQEASARAADLAASYQAAIVDSLAARVERGLEQTGLDRLAVGGGVAANGALRERLGELGVTLHVPARVLCTDNAAMIASAARYGTRLEYPDYLGLDAYASGEVAR